MMLRLVIGIMGAIAMMWVGPGFATETASVSKEQQAATTLADQDHALAASQEVETLLEAMNLSLPTTERATEVAAPPAEQNRDAA